MNVLDGEGHLHEPVEDLVLTVADCLKINENVNVTCSTVLTSSNFLLVRNLGIKVTTICVVHDDAEAAFIHERLLVGDDVRMSHRFEHVHLDDT